MLFSIFHRVQFEKFLYLGSPIEILSERQSRNFHFNYDQLDQQLFIFSAYNEEKTITIVLLLKNLNPISSRKLLGFVHCILEQYFCRMFKDFHLLSNVKHQKYKAAFRVEHFRAPFDILQQSDRDQFEYICTKEIFVHFFKVIFTYSAFDIATNYYIKWLLIKSLACARY